MKVYLILLSLMVFVSCSKRNITGEDPVNYMFSGTITNCSGNPIVGAELSLNNYNDIKTQTNDSGEWTLEANNVAPCTNDNCTINITFLSVDDTINSSFTVNSFELNEEDVYVKTEIIEDFNTGIIGVRDKNCDIEGENPQQEEEPSVLD